MGQHYTRNTVSAAEWCTKCQKQTQHRIDDRRKGPCMECMAKLETKHDAVNPEKPAEQTNLFDAAAGRGR
jgi:hypothetical protein